MLLASGHTILWRLSDETGDGPDVVSIVLSKKRHHKTAELEIETDIISAPFQSASPETPVDIAWDKKDLELFMALLRNTFPADANLQENKPLELDLNDESVLSIMHVVAAARFATPYPAETVINLHQNAARTPIVCRLGERISIDTIAGLKTCIVVAVNGDELSCVLLEEILADNDDKPQMDLHDLLVLNRAWALPDWYSELKPSHSRLIH
jgi:hypothetical protein